MKSKYLLHTYVVHSIINICGSVESIAAWLTAKVSLNKEESNFQDERNLITIVEHFFTLEVTTTHFQLHYRDNRKIPSKTTSMSLLSLRSKEPTHEK